LEPHSQTDDTPQSRSILEGQLREFFGRVVYSHKTHEKCADILLARVNRIRIWQIILSAATTAGLVVGVIGKNEAGTVVSLIISAVLLALNAYTKDNDDGALAQKHRKTGSDLWFIRERSCSLLVDVAMKEKPLETLQQQRDQLIEQLGTVYAAAPSTNSKAYMKAQEALQKNEDMTFSDEEIDAFLPKELKRGQRPKS
jgi:SMODS and SLOG-associating 2TM effector domain family 4